MRAFDNGSCFTVTASSRDVEDFARRWPCSGLAFKPLTAQFEKRSFSIVDSNDATNHPDADGSALLALVGEMEFYGRKRLGMEA